jgi:hypothetical protein
MQKRGEDDIEKKNREKKQRRTKERTQKKKNQEQREERLKRGGEGKHSPAGACIVTFAFAFSFTR